MHSLFQQSAQMTRTPLFTVTTSGWDAVQPVATQAAALAALEDGKILFIPDLSFPLLGSEREFLSPRTVQRSKNVSYDPATGEVAGTGVIGFKLGQLRGLLDRYAQATAQLVRQLLPAYRDGIHKGQTSLRPVEVAGRKLSWRQDDSRLHIDSFPSRPTQGNRILRVFCNINQEEKPRMWRIGEPFEAVAHRFWPRLAVPDRLNHLVMCLLRLTRGLRTPYDDYMLQLHDRMKQDQSYQALAQQTTYNFPAGSTWICYTDQVPHAAMSGIHQLEQTYHVSVACLRRQDSAPLRVLETLARRKLA